MNQRMKKLRQTEHLSLNNFALRIGYSKSYLGMIEIGKRKVTNELVHKLVEKFYINEKWLRFGTGDIYNHALIKKRNYYESLLKTATNWLEVCKKICIPLYFDRNWADQKLVEFDFDEAYPKFTEDKIRNAPIEPLQIIKLNLEFYDTMKNLIDYLLQTIDFLESFEYKNDYRLVNLKKEVNIYYSKILDNIAIFSNYLLSHKTNEKIISIPEKILTLVQPLNYRQQIDLKKAIEEILKH